MILIVTSYFPYDFKENWVYPELRGLSKNAPVFVMARSSSGNQTRELPENASEIKESLVSLAGFFAVLRNLLMLPALVRLIIQHSNNLRDFVKRFAVLPKALACVKRVESIGITHVHVHNTTTAATLGLIIAKMINVNFSFTVHTSGQFNEKFRRNYTGFAKESSFVRTISKKCAGQLREFIPGNYRLETVYMGVDVESNKSAPNPKDYKNPSFLMAAALEDYKGIDIAINAIKLIALKHPDFSLDIYGEGSKRAYLKHLITRNGLDGKVSLCGVIEHRELLNIMSHDDRYNYFLLTSRRAKDGQVEGIPVAIMEAMNAGILPVIVDNGATSELVDNRNGVVIEQPNISCVAAGIDRLLDMGLAEKRLLATNARLTIQDFFQSEKNAKKLFELLN